MTDTELLDGLCKLCGYVENGTDTTVHIYQDDATKTWHVKIGNKIMAPWSWGLSFRQAIENAIHDHLPEEEAKS